MLPVRAAWKRRKVEFLGIFSVRVSGSVTTYDLLGCTIDEFLGGVWSSNANPSTEWANANANRYSLYQLTSNERAHAALEGRLAKRQQPVCLLVIHTYKTYTYSICNLRCMHRLPASGELILLTGSTNRIPLFHTHSVMPIPESSYFAWQTQTHHFIDTNIMRTYNYPLL